MAARLSRVRERKILSEQPPPHDIAAEQCALGGMMLAPDVIDQVADIIGAGDFYRPTHATIYNTIMTLHTAGSPADLVTVAAALGEDLKRVGGVPYLHTLISAVPTASNATHYARIVAEQASLRKLVEMGTRLVQSAGAGLDSVTLLERVDQDVQSVRDALSGRAAGTRLRATAASTFTIRRPKWLWHDRIPIGEITLIAGREGVGKSIYLADLTAKITRGLAEGEYWQEPRAVIYLAAEDSWSYTVAARMLAAGADLDQVYRIDVEQDSTGLLLPRDCRELADMARSLNAAAIMCDPIISFIDDKLSTDRARELRVALEPLRRAAESAGCAVPALVHFNKRDGDVLTKISGSRGWVEVARAAIGMVRDEDNGYCVLSQIKNNLGRLDLSHHSYRIVSHQLQADDGIANVGRIEWLGKVERGVEDVMSTSAAGRGRVPSDGTEEIVNFVVVNGATTRTEIRQAFPDLRPYTIDNALQTGVRNGSIENRGRGAYGRPRS